MPQPTGVREVPTAFGSVRVTEWVRPEVADRIPVLLAPGWGSGTPAWDANVRDLMADRQVIAVDAIGDAGRSVQRVPLSGTADQAQWLAEVLDVLQVSRVHAMGPPSVRPR